MTCETALEQMLEADASELEGQGTSALARHVGSCAKCGAVARHLSGTTHALVAAATARPTHEFALPASQTKASRRLTLSAGITSLAASALLAVAIQYGITTRPTTPAAKPVVNALPRAGVEMASRRTGMIDAHVAQPPAPAAVRIGGALVRVRAAAPALYAAPTAMVPVAMAAVPLIPSAGNAPPDTTVVTVTPPPGTRATIIATSQPGITVVWLSDAQVKDAK